jgi:NAD+ synthase
MGVIIGLSGGIDFSVVSFLSVRALGKDRVFGLIMPEKESSPENIRDAEEIANSLEIKYEKIDLTPFFRGARGL